MINQPFDLSNNIWEISMKQFWAFFFFLFLYSLFLSWSKPNADSKLAIFSTFLDSCDRLLWTEHMKGADTQFSPFTYVTRQKRPQLFVPAGQLTRTD